MRAIMDYFCCAQAFRIMAPLVWLTVKTIIGRWHKNAHIRLRRYLRFLFFHLPHPNSHPDTQTHFSRAHIPHPQERCKQKKCIEVIKVHKKFLSFILFRVWKQLHPVSVPRTDADRSSGRLTQRCGTAEKSATFPLDADTQDAEANVWRCKIVTSCCCTPESVCRNVQKKFSKVI